MSAYETEQENFWAGEFGDSYIARNAEEGILRADINLFSRILEPCVDLTSVLELGCNIGLNLEAIRFIDPRIALSGVEINETAQAIAAKKDLGDIHLGSILEPLDLPKADLTFTKTVLIHINPDALEKVYRNLVTLSNRYVLVVEYYNPSPVSVTYRGNEERLFKRDFAGELMDRHGLKLVTYGFSYHRDKRFPQDDFNWFLMEKADFAG